jgi:hypothetical protein
MLDAEARREVEGESTTSSQMRTLLVEIATGTSVPPTVKSKRERLAALRRRHEVLQSAWMREFQERGAEVRPLTVGTALVVSAPVSAWQAWTRPGGWLAIEPSLRVHASGRFEAGAKGES